MTQQETPGILAKAFAVVQVLKSSGELTVAEISQQVREPLSSTYRLVKSLQALDWIAVGSARGRYRLGLFFIRIGGLVSDLMDVRELARPHLRALREETHLTTYLSVRRGTRSVCIDRIAGRSVHSLEYRLGDMLPLNVGGAPRALLAFLPPEEQKLIIRQLGQEHNERYGKRGAELLADLETIRRRGWALSINDVTTGIAAVGAPVFNHRGELVVAVSLAGLPNEVVDNNHLVEQVVICAAEISRSMGFNEKVVRSAS
ncbi:IclR family transcriptional regulator [Nesterenkonia muleiensis]|uniref:IclR family transcriptional regulator n=1 Tax=Nesterenkonia muleiensis TaxID=2282648 RepID=UPI000E727DFA|nr:IclR family transcriptional regulator [Nesterenkonia muleiensis]